MNIELLRTIRNILYRTTLICFVLNLFMAIATFGMWDTWMPMTAKYFHTSSETLAPQLFNFFATTKFYFLFVLLAPALAFHWTVKEQQKLQEGEERCQSKATALESQNG